MSERSELLATIHKLRAHAISAREIGNEQEAVAFEGKVAALMAEHHVTEEELLLQPTEVATAEPSKLHCYRVLYSIITLNPTGKDQDGKPTYSRHGQDKHRFVVAADKQTAGATIVSKYSDSEHEVQIQQVAVQAKDVLLVNHVD